MDLVYRITFSQSLADNKNPFIGRFSQRFIYIGYYQLFIFDKPVHALSDHAESLLYGFFECTSDSHDFSHRFHAAAQFTIYPVEFTQIPPRNFTYDIVESRFEKGRRCLCYRVFQVEKAVP